MAAPERFAEKSDPSCTAGAVHTWPCTSLSATQPYKSLPRAQTSLIDPFRLTQPGNCRVASWHRSSPLACLAFRSDGAISAISIRVSVPGAGGFAYRTTCQDRCISVYRRPARDDRFSAGFADKRVALVVGNSAYQNVTPLDNQNDARLMADTLRSVGFSLVGGGAQLDLDKGGIDRAVRAFGAQLQGADVGLFYYAGPFR